MLIAKDKLQGLFEVAAPVVCPRCGRDLVPEVLSCKVLRGNPSAGNYTITITCSICRSPIYLDISRSQGVPVGKVNAFYPADTVFDIPQEMLTLYPNFAKLYRESAIAEAKGLSICGMGYRKALETLVKEYALGTFPDNADSIRNETLSKTIQRINNQHIQTLAKASTWLGNDQTHLEVKHPNYGVSDMKNFIKALCYFILMEETFKNASTLLTSELPR